MWTRNETDHKEYRERIKSLEDRIARHDIQYAVINSKLTAILWGLAAIGTALIGVLVKTIFQI